MTNKYSNKEYVANDPVLESLLKEQKLNDDTDIDLTCSPVPNTTMRIISLKNSALQINLYDTPGIPSKNHFSYYFDKRE